MSNPRLLSRLRALIRKTTWSTRRRHAIQNDLPADLNHGVTAPEWELASSWDNAVRGSYGWEAPSIAEAQRRKWPWFIDAVSGTGPLGVSHEANEPSNGENEWAHNLIMSYAYVLARSARQKERISILDWGGGIGHYYRLSKLLIPHLEIEYVCYDLPALCEVGRSLNSGATFCEDPQRALSARYDLVIAGSSLWYERDWESVAGRLASAARGFVYLNRMIFVEESDPFVVIQRPWRYGYDTTYKSWVLNRLQFIAHLEQQSTSLVREFYFGRAPEIFNAPELGSWRGFLFECVIDSKNCGGVENAH